MQERIIMQNQIDRSAEYLFREEKSAATQEKYIHDVQAFQTFAEDRCVTQGLAIAYKKFCMERGYAVRSINSRLASVNSFFEYLGWCATR